MRCGLNIKAQILRCLKVQKSNWKLKEFFLYLCTFFTKMNNTFNTCHFQNKTPGGPHPSPKNKHSNSI